MMMMTLFIMEKHRTSLQRICPKLKHYEGFSRVHYFGILFGKGISKMMSSKFIYIQVFVYYFRACFEKNKTCICDKVFQWKVEL